LHKLAKYNSNNKKDAEKVVKHIIKVWFNWDLLKLFSFKLIESLNSWLKIIIKIGILTRNDQFTDSQIKIAHNFKQQFHSTAMTIVSFHELDFSYDRNYIIQSLNKCKSLLIDLVETHLSEKSLNRIEQIFTFFTKTELMDSFFRERDGDMKQLRSDIVRDMNKLLENGAI
jgi:hypothetical protein